MPVGEGNVVSIEFNLLYRWHATLSEKDTAWTGAAFNEIFEGEDLSKVSSYLSYRFLSIDTDKITHIDRGSGFQKGGAQAPHPARGCQDLALQQVP